MVAPSSLDDKHHDFPKSKMVMFHGYGKKKHQRVPSGNLT